MPLTPENWFNQTGEVLDDLDKKMSKEEVFGTSEKDKLNYILPIIAKGKIGQLALENDDIDNLLNKNLYDAQEQVRDFQTLYTRYKYQNGSENEKNALKFLKMDGHLRGIGNGQGAAVQGNDLASNMMLKIQTIACFPKTSKKNNINFPTENELINASRNLIYSWVKEKYNESYADELKEKINNLTFDQLFSVTKVLSLYNNKQPDKLVIGSVINHARGLNSIIQSNEEAISNKQTLENILQSNNPNLEMARTLISNALHKVYDYVDKEYDKSIIQFYHNNLLSANMDEMRNLLLESARVLSHTDLGVNRIFKNALFAPEKYNIVKPYFERAAQLLGISEKDWFNNLDINVLAKKSATPENHFKSYGAIINNYENSKGAISND